MQDAVTEWFFSGLTRPSTIAPLISTSIAGDIKLAMGSVTEQEDTVISWLHGRTLKSYRVKGLIANERPMTIHPRDARLLV